MRLTWCKAIWWIALPAGAVPMLDGVWVDGVGPLRMMVDTGAQSSVVSNRVAARLRSTPVHAVEVSTAAGSVVAPVRVARVEAAGAAAAGVEVLSLDIDGADGVLGQSFLREFGYRVAGNAIEWRDTPPAGGIEVECREIDGRPAVRWNRLWMVLDTGASDVVLFRTGGGSPGRIRTHAGARDVTVGTWFGIRAAFVGPQPDRSEDGLLPTHLFEWVFVDRGAARVVLGPRSISGRGPVISGRYRRP